jgi:hypothetical protein
VTVDDRPDGEGDVDPGEPIRLLADLEEPVSAGLRKRVQNSIRRRHLVGDLLDFTLSTPGMVLLTYVTGLFGGVGGPATEANGDPPLPSAPSPPPQDTP